MIYIKPPRGDILLSELHDCVTTRVNYFLHRYQQDPTVPRESLKFEYLAIGTALDRVGHFMLRLLSVHSYLLIEFVASSEAVFMIERLEFLTTKDILRLIKTTLRHLDEASDYDLVWKNEIKYIFTEIQLAFKSAHIEDFKHDEKCTECYLKVPFQMCLRLVAKRELPLEKGKVMVPCGKWKPFLRCFFEEHIKKEINKIASTVSITESIADERLQDLRNAVINTLHKNSIDNSNVNSNVNSNEVDNLKQCFPPCMGYLYQNLKVNHRLSHHARFKFSLFLKDIGMSLDDSISFWRNEYSKASKCQGRCSHSWQRDSAKYTYSIRHLYGLEGKRANYSAPSCSKIQSNILGPTEEGGCPFMNCDLNQLQTFLDPKVVQNKEDFDLISGLRSRNQTMAACDYYRKALVKAATEETCTDTTEHKSPVEYFVMLTNHLNLDHR